MPVHSKYDKEKNILYSSIEGELLPSDIESSMKAITTSQEHSSDVATLWNLGGVDFSLFDSALEMMMIAIRTKSVARKKAKIAMVAGSDLSFGMSRRYESLSAKLPQRIRVFRTFSEAEDWLLDRDTS